MAPNQNFDNSMFLVRSVLVEKTGFIKLSMPYLASAFGTSSPKYMTCMNLVMQFISNQKLRFGYFPSLYVLIYTLTILFWFKYR